MYLQYYIEQLGFPNLPLFLPKYLKAPSLLRLKKIGYFCGMDYASKDIYDFSEYISRYDHSLSVCLIVYKLTKDKKMSLAGLFHDIGTPCFSHVVDYMNRDYERQESTEKYTEYCLKKDKYLIECLKEDNIDINDIINFKQYPIVDNDRPKVCADRIDGVILNGIGWTKNISKKDIKAIVQDMCVFKNEYNEDEIGFKSLDIAQKVLQENANIDSYCHSREDNYMMQFLAKITKLAISQKYISYEDLYFYNEEELFNLLKQKSNNEIRQLINQFQTQKKEEITEIEIPKIKVRNLKPLVNGLRIG